MLTKHDFSQQISSLWKHFGQSRQYIVSSPMEPWKHNDHTPWLEAQYSIHSDMVPCGFESLGHYYILHRCPSNPLSIYITINNIVVWRYWYRFVAKSRLTLSDPMDCSLPGYSVHGISQARILEWVSISFSRGSSQPRDQTCISCLAGGFFTTGATRKA